MPRSLKEIRDAARAQRKPAVEIKPYIFDPEGDAIELRDPTRFTLEETQDAEPGFRGQLMLLAPDHDAFRKMWAEFKHWEGDELLMWSQDVTGWYQDQHAGKSVGPSRSSTDTPTP